MPSLDHICRANLPAKAAIIVPLSLVIVLASCANGGSGSQSSAAGAAGDTTTTSSPGGGGMGGSAGTGGSSGAGATAGTGGSGGTIGGTGGTTGGTAGTTTTTTTTTTSSGGIVCPDPEIVAGYTPEKEPDALFADATSLKTGDKGFAAVLCPSGDIDIFAVPITVQGASLRVEAKGNGIPCPGGLQPYLRVFDENHILLGQDLDSGSGDCSLINPKTQSGVASLVVGTYYIQVENLTFSEVPSYLLDIQITPPVCGDQILQGAAGEQCDDGNKISGDGCDSTCQVEAVCGDGIVHVVAGEQCDDGNTAGGDGCSPTCQFEALLLTEVEPNTQNNPNSLDGYEGAVGAIVPAGDQDYYSFQVTVPGSTVTLGTSDGLGGCPPGADTKIYLYNPAGTELVNDDDDGPDACSLISPALNVEANNLPVGTYKIKVEDFGNDDVIASYVLLVKVTAPGCGDGVLQPGEECDDANNASGDGCSSTCTFEANYLHETEPNPLATPNSLTGHDGAIASISPIGDTDAFSFDVTVPGSSVILEVSNGLGACPFDSKLTLYSPSDVALATDDQGGISPCSKIDPLTYPAASNLPAGTYKALVENFDASLVPQYVLTFKVLPPGCGDTLLSMGEQCDDGNTASGDGCSSACLSEAPWEIEPNNDLNSATGVWPGFAQWKGSIQSVSDHDWYKLTLNAGQSLTAVVHTLNDAATCPFDTKLHLINAAGTQIVEDDDDGVGNCSQLSPALDPQIVNLPAGAYYLWVQHFSDSTAAGAYQLDLTIQ